MVRREAGQRLDVGRVKSEHLTGDTVRGGDGGVTRTYGQVGVSSLSIYQDGAAVHVNMGRHTTSQHL